MQLMSMQANMLKEHQQMSLWCMDFLFFKIALDRENMD